MYNWGIGTMTFTMFCVLFLFCIFLQIFTSKLVREVLLITYNANIGSCDCVRFAGVLC
jgi:hypothetical protein